MRQFEPIRIHTTDMRIENGVKLDYFNWMYDMMCEGRFSNDISYRKLFEFLHDAEFTYFIPHDENRAEDGVYLRWRYCVRHGRESMERYLEGPCSVLEMMIALAMRCEHIMADASKGDRTAQWFWGMVNNLGLGSMSDSNYNEWHVNDIVTRFLDRDYEPNGKGGLFTIRGWNRDAREAEIWHQLTAYLNTLG